MKGRRLFLLLVFLSISWGCGRSLERQVQDSVRTLEGADLPRRSVEVLDVQESRGYAVAEVSIRTAVKMKRVDGRWELDEVRLGDRRWESIEHIRSALREARTDTTSKKLGEVSEGIERFVESHGELPPARDFQELIEVLTPAYLSRVIWLDAWWNPLIYTPLNDDAYELRSSGPDGDAGTADDLIYRSP